MKKVMCFLMTAMMVLFAVSCDKNPENDGPVGPDGPDGPEVPEQDAPYVLSDLHIGDASFPVKTLTLRHAAGFAGYVGTDYFLYAEDIDGIPPLDFSYPLCIPLGDKSLQDVYDKVDDKWACALFVVTDREFDAKDYTFFDAIPVGILPESALETIQAALKDDGEGTRYFEGEVVYRPDKVSPARDFRGKQWLATSVYNCDAGLYDFGATEEGKFVLAANSSENWDSGFYGINDQRFYKAPVIPEELFYPDTWRYTFAEGASEAELILPDHDVHFECLCSVGDYLIVERKDYNEDGTLKNDITFIFEPLEKPVKMTIFFSYGVMVSAGGKDYPMWCQHDKFNSAFLSMGSDVPFCYLDAVGKPEDFNGKDVRGKVVGITRGEITFVQKQANAKDAGAIGVIIIDNEEREGFVPTAESGSIPTGAVWQRAGKVLKKATKVSFVPSHEFIEGEEEEDDEPELIVHCMTTEANLVTSESARLHGSTVITGNESAAVSAYFYYSTQSGDAAALKASGQKVIAGNMPPMGGDFEADITSLLPSTKYYFVAGVTIGAVEEFGAVKSFTTEDSVPTGPQAVDLGIVIQREDGTAYKLLWADYNLGATAPEEGGDYYAWGETDYHYQDGHRYDNPINYYWKDGMSGYNVGSYKWSGSSDMTVKKYCPSGQASRWGGSGSPDGKSVLEVGDDAARAVFGEGWRMPTAKEFEALAWWCNHEWIAQNGVYGMKITSTVNGRSIFLPAVGYRSAISLWHNNEGEGYEGYYWTSSLNGKDALYGSIAWLDREKAEICFLPIPTGEFNRYERYWGMQVRAVSTEETQPITSSHMGHAFVDMGNGIKMATMNIGAEAVDHSGDYFAWGETSSKNNFSWDNYRYYDGFTVTRYKVGPMTESGYEFVNLYPEDDAAHVNWGGCWRTPTAAEWETLLDKNKYRWDWEGGGFRVTCLENNNSVFLPAAGVMIDGTRMNAGSSVSYWAAGNFGGNDSRRVMFLSGKYVNIPGVTVSITVDMSTTERRYGLPIRPVLGL